MSDEIRIPDLPSSAALGLEKALESYQVPYTEQRSSSRNDMVKTVVIYVGVPVATWAAKALYEFARKNRHDMTLEETIEEQGKKTTRKIRIRASQAPEAEVRKEISDVLGVDPKSVSGT